MNGGIKERKRDEQRQLQLIYDRALIHVFFGKISSKTSLCIFFFYDYFLMFRNIAARQSRLIV